jgi:hypothetical protein
VSARVTALLIAAVVAVYLVLVGARGVAFITSGAPAAQALGVAVLVLPLLGLGLAVREIAFGRSTQRLGERLGYEGGLPEDDLPRRPSGRVVREAADVRARERIEDVERHPQDWRCWFRLSVAYDDAGDRSRARAAMRRAIALERESGTTQ